MPSDPSFKILERKYFPGLFVYGIIYCPFLTIENGGWNLLILFKRSYIYEKNSIDYPD